MFIYIYIYIYICLYICVYIYWGGFKNFRSGRVPIYLGGQCLRTGHELLKKSYPWKSVLLL